MTAAAACRFTTLETQHAGPVDWIVYLAGKDYAACEAHAALNRARGAKVRSIQPPQQFSLELVDPTAHARSKDPETSHQAAASVRRIRESQDYVLGFFRKFGPLTDEELAGKIAAEKDPPITLSPSGIRTRRSELVALSMLRDSGRRKFTVANRKTIVWERAQ